MMAGPETADTPGPLGLSGDQYWQKPLHQSSALAFGSDLLGKDVEGIFIDIPPKVHLDRRTGVPLAALRSGDTQELFRRPIAAVGQLVVVHLDSGALQAVKAGNPPPPDPDFEEPSPGWSVEPLQADLADSVDLGPRLGRYAAYILSGAEASNLREFALFPSVRAETEPETAEAIRQLREKGGPLLPLQLRKPVDLVHEAGLTSDSDSSPDPLWKLSHLQDAEGRGRLHLEYRLEALPRFLYSSDRPHLDEAGKRVHANLPVMFLAFDGKRSMLLRRALGLPVVTEPAGDPARPILSGHVSLDLARLLDRRTLPARLTVWALTLEQRAMVDLDLGPPAG